MSVCRLRMASEICLSVAFRKAFKPKYALAFVIFYKKMFIIKLA